MAEHMIDAHRPVLKAQRVAYHQQQASGVRQFDPTLNSYAGSAASAGLRPYTITLHTISTLAAYPWSGDSHIQERPNSRIIQVAPHLDQKLGNLVGRPAHSTEHLVADGLNTARQVLAEQAPDSLVVRPLGPRVRGPVEPPLRHVLEAGLLEVARVVLRVDPRAAKLGAALETELVPAVQRAVDGDVADKAHGEVAVLELEVTARHEGAEGGAHHHRRVLEAGQQGAAVDEVEAVAKGPLVLRVFDGEVAVWRRAGVVLVGFANIGLPSVSASDVISSRVRDAEAPGNSLLGLDGTQVGPNDGRVGVFDSCGTGRIPLVAPP